MPPWSNHFTVIIPTRSLENANNYQVTITARNTKHLNRTQLRVAIRIANATSFLVAGTIISHKPYSIQTDGAKQSSDGCQDSSKHDEIRFYIGISNGRTERA